MGSGSADRFRDTSSRRVLGRRTTPWNTRRGRRVALTIRRRHDVVIGVPRCGTSNRSWRAIILRTTLRRTVSRHDRPCLYIDRGNRTIGTRRLPDRAVSAIILPISRNGSIVWNGLVSGRDRAIRRALRWQTARVPLLQVLF